MVTFEEFKKIDLRVAKVLSAESIDGSDKLIKLQIDLGEEQRQLVAGLRPDYAPEDLLGRQIIVVANLAPRVMMGFQSQGMLLAAENGRPVLLQPEQEVAPGSKIN